MNKFWKWKNQTDKEGIRTLFLDGVIAADSWFDDDVTPGMFKDELYAGDGDITVWINSPGGDCIAAAQIYNMLMDYPGRVTVKIDGIAASAASVIAMAGSRILMSPVSMMMIHNPATVAMGDHNEMQKAIDMLAEVRESLINAYRLTTGLSRAKIAKLMEDETWMNANKALELGFCDEIMGSRRNEDDEPDEDEDKPTEEPEEPEKEEDEEQPKKAEAAPMIFSRKICDKHLLSKLEAENVNGGHSVNEIMDRLNAMKTVL